MTTYAPDGLFAFGNAETVELPPSDARPDTANDLVAKAPLGTLLARFIAIRATFSAM